MEKKKNEAKSERNTSLKGTVIAFIILLILAIAAFLCKKIDNAVFTILMVIISVITFFGTVILVIFSDVYLQDFTEFLEKDHFSLYGEEIQINGCEYLWQYAKKSAKDALCRQGLQFLYHKYGTSYQPKWLEYRDTKKPEEFVHIDY